MTLNHGCAIAGIKIASLLNTTHKFAVFLEHCRTVCIKTFKKFVTLTTCSVLHGVCCPKWFWDAISIFKHNLHSRGAGMRVGRGLDHSWLLTCPSQVLKCDVDSQLMQGDVKHWLCLHERQREKTLWFPAFPILLLLAFCLGLFGFFFYSWGRLNS